MILLFQKIDGVDVCLFAMYTQEWSDDSPPPNNRVLYISYLDSANYMRPNWFRTTVYHQLMLGYLENARDRGLNTAYIWACPPTPRTGDSYVLNVHPKWQHTQAQRLVRWYADRTFCSGGKHIVPSDTLLEAHLRPQASHWHRRSQSSRRSRGSTLKFKQNFKKISDQISFEGGGNGSARSVLQEGYRLWKVCRTFLATIGWERRRKS